ncbi:MAG: VCBS repeat-containing protein [Deltaproteobacteria bacterium]|nr:VCBS repeat-containing protein [Deltaproteobacteria bacterium]
MFTFIMPIAACGSDEVAERDTTDAVDTVDTVDTVDAPDTVDTVDTVDTTPEVEVTPTTCSVGGVSYPSGAAAPDNACAVCDPVADPGGFVARVDGVSCGQGMFCADGQCESGCFIDGVVQAPGAIRTGTSCGVCDPTTKPNGWSAVADGEACSDGTCLQSICVRSPTLGAVAERCAPNDGTGVLTVPIEGFLAATGVVKVADVATVATRGQGVNYTVAVPALPGVTGPVSLSAQNAHGAAAVREAAVDLFAGFGLVFSSRATEVAVDTFAVGDVDGDLRDDVAFLAGGKLFVERVGAHDGSFAQLDTFSAEAYGGGVVVGDVDGDGLADIVTLSGTGIVVFKGTSGAAPVLGKKTTATLNVRFLAMGRFDDGPSLDLAIASPGAKKIAVYLNDGTGAFSAGPLVDMTDAITVLAAGDVNGDGRDDLLTSHYEKSLLRISLSTGTGFANAVATAIDTVQTIDVGDFDGDDKGDLLVTSNAPTVSTRLYPSQGDGTLGAPVQLTGGGLVGAAAGDFNQDGHLDVVASGGPGLRLIAGRGDGTFWCTYEVALDPSPYYWEAGDLDGDGRADLVATNPNFRKLIHAIGNPVVAR